jgi:hypothetical protein
MQCSKCSASRMQLKSEKPIGTVYNVRLWQCPRCQATSKEIVQQASNEPLLILASQMPCPENLLIQ